MNINVWSSFTKRKNSTLQPTGGTTVTAVLKEATSIERPSFILMTPIADYTYVEAFGHYYFVEDVINLDASRCEIICSMDVLASYKSDITAYTAFVERAASSYDSFLADPLLSAQQKISDVETASTAMSYMGGSSFILQALTKDEGMALYAASDLSPFAKIVDPSCYQASDITDWIDKKIAQAFDLDVYIGGVKWVPINPGNIGTQIQSGGKFYVGPVDLGVPVSPATVVYKTSQITDNRWTVYPTLPSSGKYGDFRDASPRFVKYEMRLPGVGYVTLDPTVIGKIMNDTSLGLAVQMDIDFISGNAVYTIFMRTTTAGQPENLRPFARFMGNISVDVPIGKAVADMGKSVGMLAGSIAAGAQVGGVAGAAVGAVVGAVEAIHNEMTPDVSMVGGSGNKSDIRLCAGAIVITAQRYSAKDYPTNVAGRPLMQNVQLSTLSGFVKCGNASVPVNAHASERDAINNFLNTGFYIE